MTKITPGANGTRQVRGKNGEIVTNLPSVSTLTPTRPAKPKPDLPNVPATDTSSEESSIGTAFDDLEDTLSKAETKIASEGPPDVAETQRVAAKKKRVSEERKAIVKKTMRDAQDNLNMSIRKLNNYVAMLPPRFSQSMQMSLGKLKDAMKIMQAMDDTCRKYFKQEEVTPEEEERFHKNIGNGMKLAQQNVEWATAQMEAWRRESNNSDMRASVGFAYEAQKALGKYIRAYGRSDN